MLQPCWRTYWRALAVIWSCIAALGFAVATGYTLAQADPIPPASAVTPAPSGTGQLGKAPPVVPSLETKPPTVRRAPKTTSPPTERRKPRPRPSTPSPSPTAAGSPTPEPTPPVQETPEPEVSATP